VWIFLRRGRECFVRDSHLDVIGFTGADGDRFVLCLPPKTRDRAIIAAAVRMTCDAKSSAQAGGGVMLCENFAILNRLEQSQPCHLQGNSEGNIAIFELRLEVGLRESAIWNRGIVRTPSNC